MGRGIVHPVDMMANKPWSEDLLDYLAVYLADQKYDLEKIDGAPRHLENVSIAHRHPDEKESIGEEYVYRGPELQRLTAEQFFDAVWMITQTGPTKAVALVADCRRLRPKAVAADAPIDPGNPGAFGRG